MGVSSDRWFPGIQTGSGGVSRAADIGSMGLSISWITFLILGFACFAGYFATIGSGFLADDFQIIHAFRTESFWDIGRGGIFFRPLTWLLFGGNLLLTGESPAAFHLVNILLHFANALVVSLIAGKIIKKRYAGLIAGLVFALHPIHPEAVVWISGRFDLLCGLLMGLSFYFHLKWLDGKPNARMVYRYNSILLFGLACLSKETAFVFPAIVFSFSMISPEDVVSLKDRVRASSIDVFPFLLTAIVLFGFRWWLLGGIGGADYVPERFSDVMNPGWVYRLLLQPFVLLILPFNRHIMFQLPLNLRILAHTILILPFLFLPLKRTGRILIFCITSIIILSAPTSYGGIDELSLWNSRVLYIPSIFFSIILAELFISAISLEKIRKFARIAIVLFLATQLYILAINSIPWQDTGHLVISVASSTDQLVEDHKDEWGNVKQRIVVFNLPKTRLGALAFGWGFPEMLRIRHGSKLAGVDVEVFHSGMHSEAEIDQIVNASKQTDTVLWFYSEKDWVLYEDRLDKN